MQDYIERTVDLNAPVDRVWAIVSEPKGMSQWFGADFAGPFIPGSPALGVVTHEGYEGLEFEIQITDIKEGESFAFSWHPYAVDQARDYSQEIPTVVKFSMQSKGDGSTLTVKESGFDTLPADRRTEAYEGNSEGWVSLLAKISTCVGG